MAVLYVSSTEHPVSSSGNAGTFADPMGLQEAMTAAVAGDEIRVMADGNYIFAGERTPGTLDASEAAPILMTGANASGVVDGSKPFIQNTTGNDEFIGVNISWWLFSHLEVHIINRIAFFSTTNSRFFDVHVYATGSSARFGNGGGAQYVSCYFNGNGNGIFIAGNFAQSRTMIDCVVENGASFYGVSTNSRHGDHMINCVALNCINHGFYSVAGGNEGLSFTDCVAIGCGGSGFYLGASGSGGNTILRGCMAIDCTGDGFQIPASANANQTQIIDSVAILCGGYGFYHGDSDNTQKILRRCYGFSNTSGLESGGWHGAAIALAADPFIDSITGNILLADNAGADTLKAIQASAGIGEVASRYPFRSLVGTLGGGGGGTRGYWG